MRIFSPYSNIASATTLAGGTNPADLSPWAYYNSTLGVSGNHNDEIVTWPDQSGNGRHMVQTLGGRKPRLQTTSNTSPTGKQLLRYDGSDDNYDRNDFMPSSVGGFTLIDYGNYRSKKGNPDTARRSAVFEGGTERPLLFAEYIAPGSGVGVSGKYLFRSASGDVAATQNFADGFQITSWVFGPPNDGSGIGRIFRNGVEIGSGNWQWISTSVFSISSDNVNYTPDADRGACIIWDRALTVQEREGVEAWLEAEFGL